MTAINIQYTLFNGDCSDIFITDCSVGADKIADNIRSEKLFENVYYIKSQKLIQTKTSIDKAKRFISYFFCGGTMYDGIVPKIDYNYDELLFYNYDSLVTYVFKKILNINKKAVWSRFEEGYVSYFYGGIESRIVMISEFIHNFFGKEDSMKSHCDSYYFYEPDLVLFDNRYKIKKIPKIKKNDAALTDLINRCFGVLQIEDVYNKKFLFFEESFFINNDGIKDMDVIRSVVEAVGKENILIKLHPRNRINRFSKYEIDTNTTVGIPWEVIHLNKNFESKIFIAISCGSVLASKILYGEHIKTYLLYKCVNKQPPLVNDKYEEYLEKMQEKYGKDIIVPNNLEDAIILLKQEST